MADLRKQIIHSLQKFQHSSSAQVDALSPLLSSGQRDEICRIILQLLIQVSFPAHEAADHWRKIVDHATSLKKALNREVGLITATSDYFCSIHPLLINPKLVEISSFDRTIRSAHYDYLTGLLNRNSFQDMLKRELSRAKRYKHEISLIFFDLDNFKEINDTFGYMTGDKIISELGKFLKKSKRMEDLVSRFGGDEFLLLLPQTGKLRAMQLAEKLHHKLSQKKFFHQNEKIPISLSGGVASFPDDASTDKELLECADKAMYQAKIAGHNNLTSYTLEKRIYTRIAFSSSVGIRSLQAGNNIVTGKKFITESKDICEQGILLESNVSFQIGEKLEIEIPQAKGETMRTNGTVVRVEQFGDGLFDIGLSFKDGNQVSKENIALFLLAGME